MAFAMDGVLSFPHCVYYMYCIQEGEGEGDVFVRGGFKSRHERKEAGKHCMDQAQFNKSSLFWA